MERRSKTGLPGAWEARTLEINRGPYGYCCLTDVPQAGKLGLLWKSLAEEGFPKDALLFSLLPLDF